MKHYPAYLTFIAEDSTEFLKTCLEESGRLKDGALLFPMSKGSVRYVVKTLDNRYRPRGYMDPSNPQDVLKDAERLNDG